MAETQKEELDLEEFERKEEIVSIKEEILLSSTVEETCSVDKDMKGKLENNWKLFIFLRTMKYFTWVHKLWIMSIQHPAPLPQCTKKRVTLQNITLGENKLFNYYLVKIILPKSIIFKLSKRQKNKSWV